MQISRRYEIQYDLKQYTSMDRGIDVSSERFRIRLRFRISHTGRGQHATTIKEKSKSGLSKAVENYMFKYGEKNSSNDMQTKWENSVQHIVISLVQDISMKI